MAESEILGHGHTEEVGEVGSGDWAVGPCFEGIDRISINHVRCIDGCDIVGVATVAVVRQVVSKNNKGGEWIMPRCEMGPLQRRLRWMLGRCWLESRRQG